MLESPPVITPETTIAGNIALSSIPDDGWLGEFTADTSRSRHAPAFIHIRDNSLTKSDALINIAVRNPDTRAFLTSAAALGYLQYYGKKGEARLVHRSRIPQLWKPVRNGAISVTPDGIFYTLDHRLPLDQVKRLLVVFSGVALEPRSSSLWRYFERNFRHIDSNVPGDTAVLRIADVGGILGSFYMDTADHPTASQAIKALITTTSERFAIPPSRICLLGSSKGASGAVHYGTALNVPYVAVEPILSDEYYEQELHDIHFTAPTIFCERKADLFKRLAASRTDTSPFGYIFTSPASPQYAYITEHETEANRIVLVTTRDSRISDHPDVARTVLGPTVALTNSILLGWPTPPQSVDI